MSRIVTSAPLRLLLVEDNPGDARLVGELLGEGHLAETEVSWEQSLDDGLAALREATFDVVVADLGLPDSEGEATVARIVESAPGIPLVVLTGRQDNEIALRALEAGASEFLQKNELGPGNLTLVVEWAMQRRKLESEAEAQWQLSHAILNSLSQHIAVLDADGVIEHVNDAWRTFAVDENGGSRGEGDENYLEVAEFGTGEEGPSAQSMLEGLESVLAGSRPYFGAEYPYQTPDEDRWFRVSVVPLSGDARKGAVVSHTDITRQKKSEEALEHRALHDELTGLPNRTLFRSRVEHALERTDRAGTEVAVLFLDLDRFKSVNDSLGHAVGDDVLRAAATRLAGVLREEDTIARVGGDEFAILLEDLSAPSDIEPVTRRIGEAFTKPFHVHETEFSLGVSIGVAHSGGTFDDPDELMRLADAAMYRVKGGSSTNVHVFEPDADHQVTERLHREAALDRALEKNEFVVHYQPLYELGSMEIVGAEALVRWGHPEQGLVAPGDFIPLAEETGQIVAIGRTVLRQALPQIREWRDAGLLGPEQFRLGVNISTRQHQEKDFAETITEAARDADVPLSMLALEITESIAMSGRSKLEPLQKQGLSVAIDDFGTGYASLQYLQDWSASTLKIDRSFIAKLPEDGQTARLVKSILYMARTLGMGAIAEGIETEEQRAFLKAAGCPYGQGFLFAKPVPAGEFRELLLGEEGAAPRRDEKRPVAR